MNLSRIFTAILVAVSLALLACDSGTGSVVSTPTAEVQGQAVTTSTPPVVAQPTTTTTGSQGSSLPAADRVKLVLSTQHGTYPVFGATPDEIFAYIDAYGPTDDRGQRASGVVDYESSLDWASNGNARACAITSMTITIEMDVLVPALDGLTTRTPGLQASWRGFAESVAAHEQRHVDIYTRGANTIAERMRALQPTTGCAALEGQVKAIWEGEQQTIDAEQERFHADEKLRIDGATAPLKAQIDANRARLQVLAGQIAVLEGNLNSVSAQINPLRAQLEELKTLMSAIERQYPDGTAPGAIVLQYEGLLSTYNGLIPRFNGLVDQYQAIGAQHAALVSEHNRLLEQTNGLIDQARWIT